MQFTRVLQQKQHLPTQVKSKKQSDFAQRRRISNASSSMAFSKNDIQQHLRNNQNRYITPFVPRKTSMNTKKNRAILPTYSTRIEKKHDSHTQEV